MDTLSLYYFSELAKDLHITRTANRLFISQQTLSNHIMRLEEYYGVKLLNRKPTLSLTYAGEQVLAFAENLNRENANLQDMLADIKHQKRGLILFGASTLRMSTCLPDILPAFSASYPKVEIRITDTNSKRLEQLILSGDLDLAIVISGDENSCIHETHLMSDQIYLCVTETLLRQYYGNEADELKRTARKGADVKNFSRLPFCILNNRMGQNIQKCFDEAGVVPDIYTTSEYVQISTSIGLKGLAACFATRTSLLNQKGDISEDVCVFPLSCKGQPLLQQISIIRHRDRYLSGYSQYFINLILEYFHTVEMLPIEQLVNLHGRCDSKSERGGALD